MTKSQSSALHTAVKGWERVQGKITVLGEDDKGGIVCNLETPAFNQRFVIGKRGALNWKYKYPKVF